MTTDVLGASIKRVEDPKLITGGALNETGCWVGTFVAFVGFNR